jgi:DNA-binding IclR family transcriptional regulator
MHASALGKAYLSALDDDELEETLASLDFVGGTERAVKSAPELRYAVATVREAGYATDLEECLPGVVCVAAPLRLGKDKLLVGAVGISGPRERLMALGLDAAARAIREEIRQLESSVVGEAAHHP